MFQWRFLPSAEAEVSERGRDRLIEMGILG